MKNRILLFSTLALTSFFISCSKEDSLTATDNSPVVASVSIDLINELDIKTGTEISLNQLTAKGTTAKSAVTSCATVTLDPVTTTFPKTFYVNFGTGCTSNGITRKGILKVTFSNNITVTGSIMTVERVNYFVNDNKVEGKIEYKNTTESPTTPKWTRTVTNGVFTDTKGNTYSNSGSHTIKQTAGVSTPLSLSDDSYEMTEGTLTVTKQNGAQITLTVSESLVKNYSCDYISKGKIKVVSQLLNGTIDYGTGDCDNEATYTQNGIIFPFTM